MIDKNNIEEYILLAIDNELSVAEQNEMHHYLQQNASALAQYQSAKDAILVADEQIKLPSKMKLYAIANERVAPKLAWYQSVKMVAGIALLVACSVGLYLMNTITRIDETAVILNSDTNKIKNNTAQIATIIDTNITQKNTSITAQTVATNINEQQKNTFVNNKNKIIYKVNTGINSTTNSVIETVAQLPAQITLDEMELLPSLFALPISADPTTNVSITHIVPVQKIVMPKSILIMQNKNNEISFNLPSANFLENNKAFQFIKKVNNTIALINTERKNIKENGVELEVGLPSIFNKKQN